MWALGYPVINKNNKVVNKLFVLLIISGISLRTGKGKLAELAMGHSFTNCCIHWSCVLDIH